MKRYKTYKNSGFDWIGSIPEGWQVKRVKHECKVTDGTHFSPKTTDEGKPYITVSNVNRDTIDVAGALLISEEDFALLVKQGCQPKVGDVLLAKDGTVGRSAIVGDNNDFVCLSSLGILSPSKNLNSQYLKYSLDSMLMQDQMASAMAGSALRRITISKINEFILLLPPMDEQETIAAFLDHKVGEIDSAVSAIDAQIEDLKAYRQSVISEAVTKGLDQNAKMKDSGIEWIGEIQERWIVSKLKYVADIVMGQSPDGDSISDKGTLPFMQGNAEFGTKYPSVSKFCDCPNKCSRIGDILMSVRAPVGALNISDRVYGIGRGLCSIKAEGINRDYLFYNLLNSVEAMRALSDGSTFEAITVQNLSNLPLCVPSLSEQQAIASYLDHKVGQIDSAVNAMNSQIDDLNALKQAIISEAVTGKIDVRDWTPSV